MVSKETFMQLYRQSMIRLRTNLVVKHIAGEERHVREQLEAQLQSISTPPPDITLGSSFASDQALFGKVIYVSFDGNINQFRLSDADAHVYMPTDYASE